MPRLPTTSVLIRLDEPTAAAITAWCQRQNASTTKRLSVVRPGKAPGFTVPDFVRAAVTEKLKHLARSTDK